MSKVTGLRYWLNAWIPVALGVGVIVLESTTFMGADHSSGPLRFIYEAIFGPISTTRWNTVHGLIRESGHFLGYGMIGLAWLRAWRLTLPQFNFTRGATLALLGTALLASADEYHQSFLPNRTGSPGDVLLDCSGAIVLLLATYVLMSLCSPKKLAPAA